MNDIILIIANGPSALKYEYGNEIDTFKNVARINNYQTNSFEKYIGSKTTIWFNGANKKLKPRFNFNNEIIVFVPYEILKAKEDEVIRRTPKRLQINTDKYTLISKQKMKYYETISNIKRPTTGFNSILWALDNYKKVIIHGFDFFLEGKEHYYDSFLTKKISNLKIVGKARKHDNVGEKKFIQALIKENKVIQLSDFLKR
tara:strand:- start:312 stop:914 length:603 start_codon:yes stop_codon:yes gene_type:complete